MMRILVIAMLLMLSPVSFAAVRITAQADKNDLTLGEAMTVEIRITGADEHAIDSFTLDTLREDFDVAAVSRSVRPQLAIITATLHPLRRGAQFFPALTFRTANSTPFAFTVREAGTIIPRVIIRTGIDPAAPRVRQASLLVLEILDNGSMQWSAVTAPDAPGMHLRTLAPSQHTEVIDGMNTTVHRYAWAALPLRDGPLRVNFPRINATKFGSRLRYAVPPLQFNADPIPAWVPIHVPVGPPQIESAALPESIETQRPFNWQLRLTGAGLSEQGITKVIGVALHSNNTLFFYPPAVQLEDTPRASGPQQTFLVTIPLRILHTGEVHLPRIVFPYYDLTREQLDAARLDAPHITAFNPLVRTAARGAIGLMLLAAGITGAVFLSRFYRRARRRAAALRQVRHAADAVQLKAALLKFNCDQSAAPTLGRWLQSMPNVHVELKRRVRQLEQACYGPTKQQGDFQALRSAIVTGLQHR